MNITNRNVPTIRLRQTPRFVARLFLCLLLPLTGGVHAVVPSPGDPPPWLDYWSFSNTNTWATERGHEPVSFTNIDFSLLGNGYAVVLDSTNTAWLHYNIFEADGSTNLTVETGTVLLWFAPHWASTNQGGEGPGDFGRLIDVGSYTTNASHGWWSIYLDPEGETITFAAQTNGAEVVYLTAPIAWTTSYWHQIAITYSPTNTALYLDGALATNGPGMTVWPGPDVLADGLFIGSDNLGTAQARGMIDDVVTYDYPLEANAIGGLFLSSSFYYYMNPANPANFFSASYTPTYTPQFNAITGSGILAWLGTNAVGCVTSTNVWLTNMVAVLKTNATTDAAFGIAGGADGLRYDVFANSILVPASSTNAWAWMGQGFHCNTYALTNLEASAAFLILGTPLDSDNDGLTDAYEQLVSKTDPHNPDTDGDGMRDGWEVLWGTNPNGNDSALAGARSNYTYDLSGWLGALSGTRSGAISSDNEGNVLQATE